MKQVLHHHFSLMKWANDVSVYRLFKSLKKNTESEAANEILVNYQHMFYFGFSLDYR